MDDSPRKAETQPFNHLCVKEYTNVVRNRDLASLEEEKAQLEPPSPPPPAEDPESQSLPPHPPQLLVEIPHPLLSSTHITPFELPPAPLDPPQEFQFDQSIGIQPGATLLNPLPFASNIGGYTRSPGDNGLGQAVIAPQMLFKNPSPSMLGYQNPQAFQQLNQSTNPFTFPKHAHHPSTDASVHFAPSTQGTSVQSVESKAEGAKASSDPASPASYPKKRKRKDEREAERKSSRVGSTETIEYDETLLAVVGILDEVKFQSNVASWVKASGLWGPYPPQNSVDIDALTQVHLGKGSEDVPTSSDSGSVVNGRHGEGKRQRMDPAVASVDSTVIDGSADGGSLNALTNEKRDREDVSETLLWFNNPPTMQHWVDRGRRALSTLGLPIEHGLKQ